MGSVNENGAPSERSGLPRRPPGGRGGFTLAELAVVVMVVGILAGVAVPNLREAMFKADAAAIISDVNTIALAAYEYMADHGSFPSAGGLGVAPPDLVPYLPDNFAFGYRPDIQYYWFSIRLPNSDNYWNTRDLGIVLVMYPPDSPIGNAMRSQTGPNRYWSTSLFYVVYPG